jgi:glycosyltransferase involved in cell wall biosynthesis
VARAADAVVAVSEEDRRRMIEVERIPPAAIRLVRNGIPPLPPPGGRDVRAELGVPAGAPLVVSVSVLRRQKALDLLVRAGARVRADFPDLRIAIAGAGFEEERALLLSLTAELGLEDAVLLVGPRRDVADLLAAADVAVNCSSFEGTPLAVIEYMAAGKAIVATRVGGVPEIVEDGVHGLLVEPGDVDGLAAAIAALLRDPARRAELGARALERQRAELGLDTMLRRLEALYEELYARTRRARGEGGAPVPGPA